MNDDRLRLQCPNCRAIDWSRDGFTMTADVNGQLHRIRVAKADPTAGDAAWACERCGHRPDREGDLVRHLLELQVAHID
ncbi:MAG TPA: hypothetical protein VFO73_05610 [Candidatus Limnocylindrales bacterium]|nr:hypothetical protein [Candidatus Limnocylindrales bacterium]